MESIGETVKALKLYSYKAVPLGTSYKAIKQYSYNEKDTEQAKRSQRIAWRMVDKLNAPNSYQFFLKCAWHLPENIIWGIIERSSDPKITCRERWAISALSRELKK